MSIASALSDLGEAVSALEAHRAAHGQRNDRRIDCCGRDGDDPGGCRRQPSPVSPHQVPSSKVVLGTKNLNERGFESVSNLRKRLALWLQK